MLRRPVRRPLPAGLAAVVVLALAACSGQQSAPTTSTAGTATTAQPPSTTTPTATPTPTGFDRTAHSIDDPTSIWVVVDKKRPLQPKSYVPTDLVTPEVPHTNVPQLRKVAATALVTMFDAADEEDIKLYSLSAYRSYATQTSIFDRNTEELGAATTLKLTAKPGFSEHQTGLADDLGDGTSCDLAVCFESHPAAKWLLANSWKYGWILRYPLGYTAITGIQTEPWHFRYVGVALATEMHRTGTKTLEQFFGLPDSATY